MIITNMFSRSIDDIFKNKAMPCWLPAPTCIDTLSDIASLDQFDEKWKNARFLPWRFFHIDYDLLQQKMGRNNDIAIIAKSLQDEWIKVHEFYILKRSEIDRRIISLQNDKRSTTFVNGFQSLLKEIFELYRFTKLNYCGFLLLFKQFDRLVESTDHTLQQVELRRLLINKPFWKHSIEYHRLAVEASYLYMTSPLVATKKPLSLLEQYDITAFINTLQQDFARAETSHASHVAPPQQQASINNDAFKGGNVVLSSSPSSACSTRSCETTLSSEAAQPQPRQRYDTYWIHPNNVVELMLYLSDKMIVSNDSSVPHRPAAVYEIGSPAEVSSTKSQYKVTTVYMDTPQLTAYKQISNKQQDTTSMTRIRWYDGIIASGSSEEMSAVTEASHVMMEQKMYDNRAEQCWIQQKVWLKSKHLEPWLSGSFSLGGMLSKESCQYHKDGYSANVDDIHGIKESCLAVEAEIHRKHIIPVLKVTQNRLVYASMDRSITISIDSDIAIMRALPTKVPQSDQYPYNDMCLDDIVRSPQCIVRINKSTDDAENNNKWLIDLIKCGMLAPAVGFSAYLHGVEALLGAQQTDIPLPKWTFAKVDGYIGYESLLTQYQQKQQPRQHRVGVQRNRGSLQTTSGNSSRGSSCRSNSSRDMHSRSTDTIATIITCYDDENDENDEKQPASPSESPSTSTTITTFTTTTTTTIESPLLHPQDGQKHQRSGMRRSFDSYCSFDHPTSSRSDPTNCKSCIGKMSLVEHQSIDMRHHLPPETTCEKEIITFSSFMLQTFWPRKFRSFEKEPLLARQPKRHRSTSSSAYGSSDASCAGSSHCDNRTASKMLQATLQGERFSRASIFTMTCVVMSFSMSCILYITVLTKL